MFGEPVVTAQMAALNYRLNKVMSLSVGDDITFTVICYYLVNDFFY